MQVGCDAERVRTHTISNAQRCETTQYLTAFAYHDWSQASIIAMRKDQHACKEQINSAAVLVNTVATAGRSVATTLRPT
ncbi:hypothetical protein LNP56_28175 [Klebsiella pneumoniae subsp. pneumoniae]|nr:hypothetical protein [Klebsiella pneumoniae subsp. pneumoniae]